MKKKIYYWSPCLNPVGTIISTINSVNSINKYSQTYEAYIINSCGEWNQYLDLIDENSVKVINLSFNYFKILPKKGFWLSRFSYLIIFLISFIPLMLLLKKNKPHTIINHLITSLPLTLLNFFKFKTKFILRISGFPKMNYIRKFFWKKISHKIKTVTCPTKDLKSQLIAMQIFDDKKIEFLPDAILSTNKIKLQRDNDIENIDIINKKKLILSVGRLTKQKNFSYLIKEFKKFSEHNDNYCLYILGEGEERNNLENIIKKYGLQKKVFLPGFKKNVFLYMKKSEVFILSSLWEEVGFSMVEAAFNNSYLLCSDCPNGPSEFLNYGKNGILFKSDLKDSLYKSLMEFNQFNSKKIYSDKVILKKNTLKYSKFRHFLKIQKILDY